MSLTDDIRNAFAGVKQRTTDLTDRINQLDFDHAPAEELAALEVEINQSIAENVAARQLFDRAKSLIAKAIAGGI